ncbi:MAG: glutathione S-transferase N-terminal domain-containing protein [Solirubrobacteraceae bacterium]
MTIPISHYCEKARWALERAGLEFVEERHVQRVHRVPARRAGWWGDGSRACRARGVLGKSQQVPEYADERVAPALRMFREHRLRRR